MTTTSNLHDAVVNARLQIQKGREKLRLQHEAGSTGPQVCTLFTDLLEKIVSDLFDAAIADQDESVKLDSAKLTLVAHSGFGRREMAPYSDVDLMLLHPFDSDERILPLIRRFTQHLYDTGLDVGFSARTIPQTCQLALTDATIFTSLTEARYFRGDQDLYDRFEAKFLRLAKQHWHTLIPQIEQSRRDERVKFGETVFLLEPNIKRSRGTLRDIQLIRWVGFARYGESDPESLMQAGYLAQADLRKLKQARDFLLWIRNDLHFQQSKPSDLLDRTEQLRISQMRTYRPAAGLMPVEQFMQEYFQHTTEVREIAAHFVESVKPQGIFTMLMRPLLSYRLDSDFRVGTSEIWVNRNGMEKLQNGDLAEILRLLDLANLANRRVSGETWRAVRTAALHRQAPDPNEQLAPEAAELFLSLLGQGQRLAELLRRLHELRVLEQIVPGMGHVRGLLQFNAYHRYTVDEHSLRAVDAVTKYQSDTSMAGQIYRSLKQKRTLHLAVLIHDLGKGFVEDHSELGAKMATQLGPRLGMPASETETLHFLVLKHLRMAHLAQQFDIHNDKVIVSFAVEVGSIENLQMLYLLTLADLESVGPGVLNEWKRGLLADLYSHTHDLLSSGSPEDASSQRVQKSRQEIHTLTRERPQQAWWKEQIAALPRTCLLGSPAWQLVEEMERLRTLPHNQAIAWGRYLPDHDAIEYTVGTYEEISPGIFHKLTGLLSSQRHQILSAEINTLAKGLVLDRFYVKDLDTNGTPTPTRMREVSDLLISALQDSQSTRPVFRKVWQPKASSHSAEIQHLPTRITFDNRTVDAHTIVSVFAYDQLGLLYTIARALFELGLSVSTAKIGTHLDQVVDVFYVTNRDGKKIEGPEQLSQIRERLLQEIEQLSATPV